jgi:hypothetical protein
MNVTGTDLFFFLLASFMRVSVTVMASSTIYAAMVPIRTVCLVHSHNCDIISVNYVTQLN